LGSFANNVTRNDNLLPSQSVRHIGKSDFFPPLGTLAGGIAHDFNNILSALMGFTELCLLELDDSEQPVNRKFKSMLHAENRAKELVSQILTFSRMQEHMLTPVDISPIVKEALKLLKASLPANIELKSHITSREQVMADPTQIHQIILNLCTNAYHAMEGDGGCLTVSLTSIQCDDQTSLSHGD
jgi:signal transduction histidine kinase